LCLLSFVNFGVHILRMIVLIKAAQLILSLSILVVLHELGHFIPAKLFKTRVEKFYLFFNPWFSLIKFKKGETEYGIGWLPLGGYVKIAGMIDESMDTEAMKQPAQAWEFRSKPAWQRLIIMAGGVTVNLILGYIIYSMVLFAYGEKELPPSQLQHGLHYDQELIDLGFENGDNIVAIDQVEVSNVNDLRKTLFLEDASTVQVERDGERMDIQLPNDFGQYMIDSGIKNPFEIQFLNEVESVEEGMPAAKAGIQPGDLITSVNGMQSPYFNDFVRGLAKSESDTVLVGWERNGDYQEASIVLTPERRIGFVRTRAEKQFEFVEIEYTFGEAITSGFSIAKETLQNYVLSLRFIFSKKGVQEVGSFVTLGSIFSPEWDWEVFWKNTAFLSLILAFMNILPIPALDGGHIVFLLYEIIAGKPAPEKVLEKAQIVGVILLLGLMVLALGNDLFKVFTGGF
jgi:regulator of sigma E protease